jgi:hypothetical protein
MDYGQFIDDLAADATELAWRHPGPGPTVI